MRQYNNEYFSNIRIEDCNENFSQVQYIEMSIDNICNLQCQMCNSKFSSKLINRDKLLGNTVYKKLEPSFRKFDSVDLSKLEKVKILGGEPFITPNFSKFIDRGAKRIESNYGSKNTVSNVSFLNPDQSIVTVVINQTSADRKFHVVSENRQFEAVIPAKTVATYKWKQKK